MSQEVLCDVCKKRKAYRNIEVHEDLSPEDCKAFLATKSMIFKICQECEEVYYCKPCRWQVFCHVHSILTQDEILDEKATFLMDTQERRRFGRIFERIEDLPVTVTQLRAGDFLISGERGDVLIERKTIGDLVRSVSTRQLFKELKQMYEETKKFIEDPVVEVLSRLAHRQWVTWAEYMLNAIPPMNRPLNVEEGKYLTRWTRQIKTPYDELTEVEKESDRKWAREYFRIVQKSLGKRLLLVEGSPVDLLKKRRGWSLSELLKAMVCVPISWNINLVWIENTDLIPSFLYSIADYLGKPAEPYKIYGSRPKRKLRSLEEQQRFFIEGIAGIGGKIADKWLKFAGSPANLFKMVKEGKKIPAMGEKRTAQIKDLLDHGYQP